MSEKIIHIKNYISDKCFDLLKIGKFNSHIQNSVNLNNLQPRLWYDMSLSLSLSSIQFQSSRRFAVADFRSRIFTTRPRPPPTSHLTRCESHLPSLLLTFSPGGEETRRLQTARVCLVWLQQRDGHPGQPRLSHLQGQERQQQDGESPLSALHCTPVQWYWNTSSI